MADDMSELALAETSAPDFGAAFRSLPSPYMILDREFRYVEVNDAYCEVVERPREELLGRVLFDLFPNDGAPGERLRDSFRRVLDTGERDSIPLIAYPIALPRSRGGGMEMRYWSAVHTPLFDASGRTRWVMQNTVDVTELQQLKQMAYGAAAQPGPSEQALFARAREVEAINESLAKETQGLRELFMQAPGFMAVLTGEELTFALVNKAYQQLIGHRRVIGRTLAEALPEVMDQGYPEILLKVLRDREPFSGRSLGVLLQREPDAPLEERFVDLIYQPILGADGQAWGIFVEGSDVTDRIRAEQQQKLLLDELNHRVKNTLATVQAISAQTLRTTPDPKSFNEAFQARIMAVSATHDILTDAQWRGADLADVLRVELQPYGGDRCRWSGPQVDLAPSEALALGLIFHELATNAAKYGGLSGPTGEVEVNWSVSGDEGDHRLALSWCERGGPPVSPPTRRGFGARLIQRSLGADGETTMDFAPDGLVCQIELRLRR